MSGPVETELPPAYSRRAERRGELRLTLTMSNRSTMSECSTDLKSQVRTMEIHELARKISNCNNKHRLPFILLDCRGYLCYTDCHIRGAVHIACTDRFNRKRVQNAASVLDLVSTNNRRNKTHNNAIYHNSSSMTSGKYRDVIVYDEGTTTSDLNLEATWTNPVSFVLAHLLQENRQPIYLNGGMKEFIRVYRDLCDSTNRKDLNSMSSAASSPTSPFLPSPLSCQPLSPSSGGNYTIPSTPHCNESYENEPPTQVLPFLYVGNARDAADQELLKRLNIGYVLSVTMSMPYSHSSINTPSNNSCNNLTGSKCAGNNAHVNNSSDNSSNSSIINNDGGHPGLRTKLIPVSDNLCENLAPYFDEACDFIEEARRSGWSILIHCQAGISRSPTIAIAYIMKHIKLSTLEAYAFVQRSRRIISPNLNFMGQLVEFENKLKQLNSTLPQRSESTSSTTNSSSSPTSSSLYSSTELEQTSSFSSSTTSSLSSGIPSPLPVDQHHPYLHHHHNQNKSSRPLLTLNLGTGSTSKNTSPSGTPTTTIPMILAD